jgi:DNA-binding transcriptional LysR family regulator
LFIRQRNNIQLTPAGEQLLAYAEIITTAWNSARQTIGASESDSVSLQVAGVPGLWDLILQDWLYRIYSAHQKLVLHTELHGTDVLHRRILNGALDLAFVYEAPINDMLDVIAVARLPLNMVTSVAGRTTNEATRENYVLVDWGTSFLIGHAQSFPDIPVPMLHTDLGRIAYKFILDRGGSAYLAEPMFEADVKQGRLHLVEDAPAFEKTAYAVYHKNNKKKDLISQLVDVI